MYPSVWYGFKKKLIKKSEKVYTVVYGTNSWKTPQQERAFICVLGCGHSWSTCNVHMWYGCIQDKTPHQKKVLEYGTLQVYHGSIGTEGYCKVQNGVEEIIKR